MLVKPNARNSSNGRISQGSIGIGLARCLDEIGKIENDAFFHLLCFMFEKMCTFAHEKLADGRNMVAGSRRLPPHIEGSTPSANSSRNTGR